MFVRYNSEPNIQPYKKVASTAFAMGALVAIDANGFITPAVTASASNDIIGIIQRAVTATDTDYAQNTFVEVDVLTRKNDWVVADVGTGTPAQTDVGEAVEIDNSLTVDVVAVATPLVRVEKIISATKVVVSLI
jgi:hypothetical protein